MNFFYLFSYLIYKTFLLFLRTYRIDLFLISARRQSVEEVNSCSTSSKCSLDKPQQNVWGKSLNILSPGDNLEFLNCISSRFTMILCLSTTFISWVTNVMYLHVATCAYNILNYALSCLLHPFKAWNTNQNSNTLKFCLKHFFSHFVF